MDTLHVVVVGSGPVGMTTALLLARQGNRITLVDRDPGPLPGRPWQRVGVMQFLLPNTLRALGRNVLLERLPDLDRALQDAGAELRTQRGAPDFLQDMHVRRSVMERAMWEHTSREPGVRRLTGHVDDVVVEDDRAVGVLLDGAFVAADAVVDASGRAGRIGHEHRPPVEGGDSGFAYASRLFRLRPGGEPGPVNGGPGFVSEHRGFLQLVFHHDAGTFSVLFVRAASDRALAALRHEDSFMAAAAAVPGAAQWTEPDRAQPVDVVRAGANLANHYRPQPTRVTGLVAVGDAASTTNPAGARGLSLGFRTAAALADIAAVSGPDSWAAALEEWSRAQLRPWWADHVLTDAWQVAAWQGDEPDADGPVPSGLVLAAVPEHPEWRGLAGPFLGMAVGPEALDPLREEVRAMLRAGWRPRPPVTTSREDLLSAIAPAVSA